MFVVKGFIFVGGVWLVPTEEMAMVVWLWLMGLYLLFYKTMSGYYMY